MPGCESFEETGENTFEAKLITKIGPVKARFKFDVTLSDLDPPRGYTISGAGQGGAAGFAKGAATVTLSEQDGTTVLAYHVQANVGGKLAQLGARLIDGVAKKWPMIFLRILNNWWAPKLNRLRVRQISWRGTS